MVIGLHWQEVTETKQSNINKTLLVDPLTKDGLFS